MADRFATTATTMSVGGHNVTGEIIEMTDSIDTTDTTTTTTTNTDMLNSQTDPSLANTSHSAREDNNIRKRDAGGSQESSTAQSQEVISGQDADLTKTDAPTIEQSGTEIGCAETTQQNLRPSVGYKREHSHSPCSQTSPVLQQLPTSACRAVGCVVEAEQELVADVEVLKSSGGGQRELEKERQPRKRVKREATMEGGEGDGRNESTSLLTSTETPGTLQQPSATLQATPHTEQDLHSTLPLGPNQEHNIITSTVNLDATATAATPSLAPLPSSPPPPAITRGAPTRPTSLLVPSVPPSAAPSAHVQPHVHADAQLGAGGGGEEGGRFPNSEEERTPDGGIREFVGHAYHSPLRNNGEMVTPEKQPTLPNTVIGHRYPFQRMLSAENNAYRHTYSYMLHHAAENGQARMARQNSEPTNELYGTARRLFDNNGRLIQGGGESRIAML